ncbi:hypothetical protein LSTR_LSTR013334 [Laodelphax striatellus]|uniref:Uncharacterized protein n=1 Tax=Laodelphax striatellus TaxID=195883 RepID=A0A482WIK8_LAOST|nr:hypothetical protein LSTR_LSTR013334 [Laodelphax striatellus]
MGFEAEIVNVDNYVSSRGPVRCRSAKRAPADRESSPKPYKPATVAMGRYGRHMSKARLPLAATARLPPRMRYHPPNHPNPHHHLVTRKVRRRRQPNPNYGS